MFDPSYFVLFGALVSIAVALLYCWRPYMSAAKASDSKPQPEEGSAVPVSVIVLAQSDDDSLFRTLDAMLAQDYPDFEVIVVVDGSAEHAELLSEQFALHESVSDSPPAESSHNVYFTYIQPGSHNLSRRKLALTIGIKAAKGDVVLLTQSNVTIPSEQWLSLMASPFNSPEGHGIDVALGVSRMDFNEFRGAGKWYRQFDSLLSDALWIGYAAMGMPYRGDGFNLAFRRSVFFANKGYASTVNLHSGDDDLFVHQIARSSNTRLVADAHALLTLHWGAASKRVWSLRKEQYSFTSRWLPKAPFVRSFLLMFLQWLVPGLCTLSAILAFGNPNPSLSVVLPAAAAVVVLTYWGFEIWAYRRLASAYGAVRLWWAVVPFWLWRPLADTLFRLDHRRSRKKNFTWVR